MPSRLIFTKNTMAILRYGNNSSVEVEKDECVKGDGPIFVGSNIGTAPLVDPVEATTAALNEPLDFPPLAKCATPGDRIVLALDRGVLQAAEVTAAVVRALVGSGVDADGISILLPQQEGKIEPENPCRLVDEDIRDRIQVLVHEPDDRRQLAYLAADDSAEAILVNRTLHEADVVLPIGCIHDDRAAGYFGIHGVVYPTFSDEKTIKRFRGLGSLDVAGDRKRELIARVDNVAWLLGVMLTIQVVPGEGGGIAHVLAGESNAVRARGRELYDGLWRRTVSRQTDLVVAAIAGPPDFQTWENLGRAIDAAGSFADDGGAIAVCCELDTRPGHGVRHLAGGDSSRAEAMKHVSHHRPPDALPAAQLASALNRNKVYLLSRLDSATVEELDMVPLETPEELSRLIRQHPSCTLLQDAQYIVPCD